MEGGAFDFAPERSDLNQYWYSSFTIETLANEVLALQPGQTAAMISTPSIYFAIESHRRAGHRVLDYDTQWDCDPGFTFYDFNFPEQVPEALHHSFDLAVIDPPFITSEVWEKYATTARLLLKQGSDEHGNLRGRLLCSTVRENQAMMHELLQVSPQKFRPSIPNLVYQYDLYTNYNSAALSVVNPELDECVDTEPAHQGLRVASADDLMVIPTHSANMGGGMALDEHPEGESASEECLSPEVCALMTVHKATGELRKALDAVVLPTEGLVKARVRLGKAADDAARASAQGALELAEKRLEEGLGVVLELAAVVGARWEGAPEVSSRAKAEMRTKKALAEFGGLIRKHSQELYKAQKGLLVEIKESKRQHATSKVP